MTMTESVADIIAERDRLRDREKRCPTMAEAEARAMLRALQEIAEALGKSLNASPREIVEAVGVLCRQNAARVVYEPKDVSRRTNKGAVFKKGGE